MNLSPVGARTPLAKKFPYLLLCPWFLPKSIPERNAITIKVLQFFMGLWRTTTPAKGRLPLGFMLLLPLLTVKVSPKS